MRIVQILNSKAHWIFEAEEIPNWPPDAEGNPILLLSITDRPEVQEGWDYVDGIFTEPIVLDPEPSTTPPTENEIILARLDYLTMLVEPTEVV